MRQLQVLNTRPREQAAELSRQLRLAGFLVVEAPAIAIEPAWDPGELVAVRAELASGAFEWVVLASPNAGGALVDELARQHVLCGSATARALGLEAGEMLERFSARAALDYLLPRIHSGHRVLVPRAAEGRDELIEGLLAVGVQVSSPVAYRTVAVPDAADRLARGGIDILALCSPSAAASVLPRLQADVLVACIGATTAEAVRAAGARVDAIADQTSVASLVAAIETLAGARV